MPGTKHIFLGILLACVVYIGVYHFRGRKNLPIKVPEGAEGVLPCDINVTPKEVTWQKVQRFWPVETLVTYDVRAGKKWGSGYEERRFDIRQDYYLQINMAKADDRGDYYCQMKSMTNEIVSSDRIVTVEIFGITAGATYTSRDVVYYVTVLILISVTVSIAVIGIILLKGGQLQRLISRPKNYGRISYYELWQLATYSVEEREGDKLMDALGIKGKASTNPDSVDDLYGLLCSWKESYSKHGRPLNQLYEKCRKAEMEKNIQKLKDRRKNVRDLEGPTSDDMRNILRLIDQQSHDNITKLLGALRIEKNPSNSNDSGLEDTIEKALRKMEEWKQEPLSMNPNVLLSFALEDLKLTDGEKDLLTGCKSRKDPDSGTRRPASKMTGEGGPQVKGKRQKANP